ncbi:MAG: hypothetical protein OEV20_03590, partial [Actinomycetota bacterium]|nr:hypothetical protein [Actinomycetota bacterium]
SPLFVYFQISELDVLRIQQQIRARRGEALGESDGSEQGASEADASDEAPALEGSDAGEVAAPKEAGTSDRMIEEAAIDAEIVAHQRVDAEPAEEEDLEPSSVGYEASGGTRYGRTPSPGVPPVEVGLADEEGYPHKGFLDFADSLIDDATGTLELRGVLENEGEFEDIIMPGSFTRVRIPVGRFENAMLVPDRALGTDQGGRFVLVVGEGDVVEQRYVQVADVYDGMRRIVSGITPDERIVVNGLQRARPGARVTAQMAEPAPPDPGASAAPATPAAPTEPGE